MVVEHLAFQPKGIQVHVARVANFVFLALLVHVQHHVMRPSASTDQDSLAVDPEDAVLLRIQFRGELADSELHVFRV